MRTRSVDEVPVGLPAPERLVDPAARKGAREDLGAHRAEAGVAAIEERRVRGQRQQRRQDTPQVVADGDRAIRAAHAHVDVEAPGVVSLGDPAELLAKPRVVGGVDDPLIQVVGPWMRARGGEGKPHPLGEREQPRPMLALKLHRPGEALRAPGADLDLRGDQLPGRRLGQQLVLQAGGVEVLEAVAQVEALRIDDRELLLEADREVGRGVEQLP